MTKYEVKEMLSEYFKTKEEAEELNQRILKLKSNKQVGSEVVVRIKELNSLYAKMLVNADIALESALKLINKLNNIDHDVDVLKKYHIEGISEKCIAKQLNLSVAYIRTKRWRAYDKIAKIV